MVWFHKWIKEMGTIIEINEKGQPEAVSDDKWVFISVEEILTPLWFWEE